MNLLAVSASTILAITVVIVLARLNGLRSFSKMSSFDFALTVATGSILASAMIGEGPPWPEIVALCTLFLTRFAISKARRWRSWVEQATDNAPLMLMHDGVVLERNLSLARVTHADLRAKLREANALDLRKVRAVVLEATGDVSVLHGDEIDDELLTGVSWGDEGKPDRLQGADSIE